MGLISDIRKKLWIVTVLIALALIGFIVMDMTSGQGGAFGSNDTVLGKVAGQTLDFKEFQKNESILYANSQVDYYGRKDYMWNQFVERAILENDAQYNGLGVSDAELAELEFGYNLSPIVERNFRDPNTGQINREQLNQFKAGLENESLDPRLIEFWKVQRKEIKKERLQSKLEAIVTKALFMPLFMLERNNYESNEKLDFLFSRIPYDMINDEDVPVSDSDIMRYVSTRKPLFELKEESRTIKYVIREIFPTAEDTASVRNAVAARVQALKEAKNDSAFVTTNLGTWNEAYFTNDELGEGLKDTIFKYDIGQVFGPYIENGEYRIAKVLNKKIVPDSVRSRHILRRVSTREEYLAAVRLIDSLKNLIAINKASFDSLAIQYSQDGSSLKGGDLGFAGPGMMVKPFNDNIFFKAQKGELKIVLTQYGVHLVQVTDYKFINNKLGVQLAVIGEPIMPGETVTNSTEDEMLNLVQQHRNWETLQKAIEGKSEYKVESEANILANNYLLKALGDKNTSTARDMIRWAFGKEVRVGDVSPEIYSTQEEERKYINRYIIASLAGIAPKGIPPASALRELVEGEVRKELKYHKIAEKIGTVKVLDGQLGEYRAKVDTAFNANVSMGSIDRLGHEVRVVATARKLNEGEISKPIKGENGVYVIQLLSKKIPESPVNVEVFRQFYVHPAKNTAITHMMEALKKNAKIKDNRFKFF